MAIKRNKTELEIVKAARKIIAEDGLLSFQFKDIANEAKISTSTLRLLFCSKEDLLARILVDHLNGHHTRLLHITQTQLNLKEKVFSYGLSMIYPDYFSKDISGCHFLLSNPAIWKALTPLRQQQLAQCFARLSQAALALFQQAIDEKKLAGCAVEHHQLFSSYARGCSLQLQNALYMHDKHQFVNKIIEKNMSNLIDSLPWQSPMMVCDLKKIKMTVRTVSDQSNSV
ncbi:TetR/AcrR family transcriptional regulator [Ferrimonas pelagia]|uniref:HTH tetR-type domain-containing protein n=1 Tax=Ferrimonas pelagia TaxID=1177826 RepID=A0ABP9EP44_9GAMM